MATKERVNIDNVVSVYSGINGKCCCGCSGKHSYASKLIDAGTKQRGYKVTYDEINDKMVKKVVGIINLAAQVEKPKPVLGKPFISTVVGKRLYIAYLLK